MKIVVRTYAGFEEILAQEIKQITVGNTPSKIAVHPDGKRIYAIASKEASVAVIDTGTWAVTSRIDVVVNPGGLFLWKNN